MRRRRATMRPGVRAAGVPTAALREEVNDVRAAREGERWGMGASGVRGCRRVRRRSLGLDGERFAGSRERAESDR
ncbi:hypothetical protein GCM10027515_07370 [Schumannella luteola]